MVSHRSGSSVLESAGKRLCAAIVASSLILSTTAAHADPPAPAEPAPAANASAADPQGSVWGHDGKETGRKVFVFGFLGAAVVAGGIGLGFHINAISKENARQDFIKQNGNLDATPGQGVQEVGPQCKGPVQCAKYSDIKNARNDSYNVATGLYAGAATAAFGAALFYSFALSDHWYGTKLTGFAPVITPRTAGASWEMRF
jgi:hypothetical protein